MSDGTTCPTVTIKLRHGGKLRRVRITAPVDKQGIYAVVRDSNYPEYRDLPDSDNMDLFELCFQDDEGDRVNLSDPRDFADAVSFFAGQGKIPSFLVDIRKRESVAAPGMEGNQVTAGPLAGEQQQQHGGQVEGARVIRPKGGVSTGRGHTVAIDGAGNTGSANLLDPASPLPSTLSLLTSDLASANGGSSFSPSAFGPAGAFSIGVGTVAGRGGGGTQADPGRGTNLLGSVDIGNILGEDLGDLIRGDASPPGRFVGADSTGRTPHSANETVKLGQRTGEDNGDREQGARWPENSMGGQPASTTRAGTLAPDSSEFIPPFPSSALPSRSSVYRNDAPPPPPPFDPERHSAQQSSTFDPQYELQRNQQYLYQQHYNQFADRQESSYAGNFQDVHYPPPQSQQYPYFSSARVDESRGLQTGQMLPRQEPAMTQVDESLAPPPGAGYGQTSRQQHGRDQEHHPLHGGAAGSYPEEYVLTHGGTTGGWASIAAASATSTGSGSGSRSSVVVQSTATSARSSSPIPANAAVSNSRSKSTGKVSSFANPVYPDELFSEEDNAIAIRHHEEQGLNPTIIKFLFKGATTDKMSGDRNGKLILLGRDGDDGTGKFWMLKSDGVDIYLVDPRESIHVLVKSPRGGYVRVRHEQFEYRYNFEFVPHPKMSHKKSGRYFVKYRRNAYIRQYFCEIRKNDDEDDAALVFKVERIP